MSKKIGIVSEGVSDYYVLKHIISRYLKELDVYTIPLNPKQDKGQINRIIIASRNYRLVA